MRGIGSWLSQELRNNVHTCVVTRAMHSVCMYTTHVWLDNRPLYCKEMSYPLSNDPLKVYYNTILSRVMNHMVVAPRFISPYMSI